MRRIVDWIIALSKRTPYSHLWHADGTCYMRRFWLMPKFMLAEVWCDDGISFFYELKPWARRLPALRLHQICTPDYDPHMHDHPWSFVSLVLRGGYMERRPVSVEPSFISTDEREDYFPTHRRSGSIALRRSTDRHLISYVESDTWTLVALGPKRHWWGFFTATGKVHWKAYPSVHNYIARVEAP